MFMVWWFALLCSRAFRLALAMSFTWRNRVFGFRLRICRVVCC
jgi:hypothetical protein